MRKIIITMILTIGLLMTSCSTDITPIKHDVVTDLYYFDVTLDTNSIDSIEDTVEVNIDLTSRVEKKMLFVDSHDKMEDSIIQSRFVHESNLYGNNLHRLYNNEETISTTHNPIWVILDEGQSITKSFTFSRINPIDYRSLIGPTGKYYLELAIYEGNVLSEEDWISTDFYIQVNRKDTPDELVIYEGGIFSIDYYQHLSFDPNVIVADIQFIASTDHAFTLHNNYIEKESAIIQSQFVLATDNSKTLYNQFPKMLIPAEYHVNILDNEILEKVYIFSPFDFDNSLNSAPIGTYVFRIAFYQGNELTESDWIETDTIYEYDTLT